MYILLTTGCMGFAAAPGQGWGAGRGAGRAEGQGGAGATPGPAAGGAAAGRPAAAPQALRSAAQPGRAPASPYAPRLVLPTFTTPRAACVTAHQPSCPHGAPHSPPRS